MNEKFQKDRVLAIPDEDATGTCVENVYVRPARPSDAAALSEIYSFYVANTNISFEYVPPTAAEMERRLRSISKSCPFLVYCVEEFTNGEKALRSTDADSTRSSETQPPQDLKKIKTPEKIAGYAYGRQAFERAAFSWLAETTVYVAREFQGRGVGSALYRALIPLLARQGFRNVCAIITSENEQSADFHLKNDFSRAGTLRNAGFKAGRWVGVDYFERQIGDCGANPAPPLPFSRLDPKFVADVCAAAIAPNARNR